MKKQRISMLVVITVVFAAFTLGLFLGRNQNKNAVTLSVPQAMQTTPAEEVPTLEVTSPETQPITFPININTASETEFMALPGIGETLAQRILAYRQEHGNFSSVEGLMRVEGIGKKRMEELLDLVTIGG